MGLFYRKDPQDKRGKWTDVFKSLLIILVFYMTTRWILWEPYVIPSGSMETTLLVQDYVLVNKWAYGLRLPFTENWLIGPETPERGDIVVFKGVEDPGIFLVKRVVGLPGDEVHISEKGFIQVNDQPFSYQEIESKEGDFDVYYEDNGHLRYKVQFSKSSIGPGQHFNVPEGHLFMMGDNRSFSADSRIWGPLPLPQIMGKLNLIWLSCKESESYSSFLCPASDFRTERFFKRVDTGE